MLEFFKSKEQRFLNKVERFIDLEKSLYDVNSEIDDIAQDFSDRNNLLTKAIEEETNEELRQKLEQKYDTFTRNHLRRVGEARKHKLSISKSMASLLKKNDDLQKGVDEYKLHKSYNTILSKYRSNEIDLNTCDTLLKAVQHKYIRKTPDGKGGWNYVYEEEKEKEKKEEDKSDRKNKLDIKSSTKDVYNYFKQNFNNKRVSTGTGDYKREGKIIDVDNLDGDKIGNSGVFVYFLEDGEDVAEKIKVNFSDQDSFKILNSNNIQKSQQATFPFMQPYLDTIREALKNKKETGKIKYADNIVFNNEGKLLLLKRSENDKTFP
ncbi:MAG: hypothetical protein M0R03_22340, partial [Novosphingobium sp.]|nr:hypothetical protein [Novosphingobium sp.]